MIFDKVNIRYKALFFTLLIVLSGNVIAQPDYKYKFISRVIAADSTATAIVDCHIMNKTQRMGTISDEFGNFTLTANVKDSIEFTAIGYEKLILVVQDSMYTNTRIVRLTPAIYELSEVNVGLFSTYERFKRDVMNTEVDRLNLKIDPISKFEIYTPPLPNQGGGINIAKLGNPVTLLYDLLSKEGKQYRHYLSVINRTADHIIVGEKFNGEIVYQLTGLKDDELVLFMSSCLFTKEYLLSASHEEINREIMIKYRAYLAEKNKRAK